MHDNGGQLYRRLLLAIALALALLSKPWAWRSARCQVELHGPAPPIGSLGSASAAVCRLNVEQSTWSHHCQRLQNVCLDSSTLIFYDQQYQELDGKPAGPLPRLAPARRGMVYRYPWRGKESSRVNTTAASAAQQPRRKAYEAKVRCLHAACVAFLPSQRPGWPCFRALATFSLP
jgi:hypothetical protein